MLVIKGDDSSWMDEGACRGVNPGLFFPERGEALNEEALRVCSRCAVKAECLDWAIDNRERWGVWGGTTAPVRRLLRRWELNDPDRAVLSRVQLGLPARRSPAGFRIGGDAQ